MKEIINQLASHDLLQNIFEGVPIRIFWKDLDCKYLGCNTLFAIDAGVSHPDELIGKSDFDLAWKDQADHYRTDDLSIMDSCEARLGYEEPQITPDGQTIWLRMSKVPFRDDAQNVIGVLGVYEEITLEKEQQPALSKSETELRNIFNTLQDVYYRTDIEGRIVNVSPSVESLMACDADELIGKVIAQFYVHESGREQFLQKLHEGEGTVSNYEAEIRRLDGEIIWVSTNAHYFRDEHGNVTGVEGTIRDVTQLKDQEEQLQLAKFVLDNAPLNITYLDSDARIRYMNKTGCEMLGYSQEELLEMSIPDIDPLFPIEVWDEHWQDLKYNKSVPVQTMHRRKSGECFPIEVIANYIEFGGKAYNVAFDRDITETKQQQDLLEASEKRFSMLFDSSSDGLFIVDMQGEFIEINRTAHERLGYEKEEMLAMKLIDLDPPEFATRIPERIALILEHGSATFETAHYRKDGSIMPVEINARLIDLDGEKMFLGVVRDISERKRLEEQLRQSQKMEAIGTLVGGIAHDFNNMLAAIQGNLYLARIQLPDYSLAVDKLANIEKLSLRAAEMVQQLLTFARKDSVSMCIFTLNKFLDEGNGLATTLIPENIDYQSSICEEQLHIKGDATQLQQVLMNLLNNAVDAVADVQHPIIRCTLSPFMADKYFLKRHPLLEATHFARISVEDNGHGIPKECLDKIFEPFFTTKEVGKGTGLGLAMLYGALQSHGGVVEVNSELNSGTLFHIYLPLCGKEAETDAKEQTGDTDGDGKNILLTDDDENVRSSTSEVLTSMGYVVLEACDGLEAMELYTLHQHKIDLIISDMIMPNMGGAELLNSVHQLDANMPFILVTGYDKSQVIHQGMESSCCQVMNKPFDFNLLSQSIQDMIRK